MFAFSPCQNNTDKKPIYEYLTPMRMLPQKTASVCFALIFAFLALPHAALAQDTSPGQAPAAPASSAVTALPPDVDPNSPLAQIIQLAQSGVDESVLVSYAGNSATPFNLTADQIVYLKDIGVPDTVVQAMIQRDQQLGAADNTQPAAQPAPATEPPTGDVTSSYFYGALAPYGGWVNVSGYGLCWRPQVVVYNSGWQPYCDHGHWVYTDDGWFWMSDYSWGWATFHYGRWFHDDHWGWCWWPDTDWAPSWVCWRYSDNYCGWAPLPPHSSYRPGIGFEFNGVTVGAGFDFGISAGFFTFVPTEHFCDPHPGHYRLDRDHDADAYRQTTIINNFDVHSGVFVNHGIDPQRISAVTHTQIHPVSIQESGSPIRRGEALGGNQTLVINRPTFTGGDVNAMHQGQPPREIPQQSAPHAWYYTRPRQNNVQPPEVSQPVQPNRGEPNQGVNNQNVSGRPTQNVSPPPISQPNRESNPGINNRNVNGGPTENYQSPRTTQPSHASSAPQTTYQAPPVEQKPQVETPQRTPSMNEPPARSVPETPAEPQSHYQDNQEPTPEYNNSGGNRYTSPRSQQQSPPAQQYHEAAPAPAHNPQLQQQQQQPQQQQGQKNKYGN